MVGKKELAMRMVQRSKLNSGIRLSQRGAEQLVEGLFLDIVDLVETGERVAIRRFGSFSLRTFLPREFESALTGKTHRTQGGTKVNFVGKMKPPF